MSFCAGMWRSISQLGQLTAARGGMQMLRRSAKTQSNFEGLTSIGFAADSSHGFGYDKDGNIVLVKPENMNINEYTSEETQKIVELGEKVDRIDPVTPPPPSE